MLYCTQATKKPADGLDSAAGNTGGKPMTTQVYYEADELQAAYTHASAHEMPQAWRNALERAYDLLLASGPITVDMDGFGAITLALIPSQRQPGLNYPVNGTCSCTAGQNGRPCAHRAAKRLLSIASEQAAARQVRTVEQARTLTTNDVTARPIIGTHRDGTPMRVSREQAFAEMDELFAD
jgi:hypothetical protein